MSNKWKIRHLQGFICVSIKKFPSCQHLIQRREVNTTSEAKHTKVLAIEKDLKTDNTKNVSDNTKEDDSENSKKKVKDISNTGKETYEWTLNNNLQWLKLSILLPNFEQTKLFQH